MTNTTTMQPTKRMTLSQMMAARDGAAYVWVDSEQRFAKVIRDGRTVARIDRHTDGSVIVTADGNRAAVDSWQTASAWLAARAAAEAIVSPIWV